jgi:hypothetical protein
VFQGVAGLLVLWGVAAQQCCRLCAASSNRQRTGHAFLSSKHLLLSPAHGPGPRDMHGAFWSVLLPLRSHLLSHTRGCTLTLIPCRYPTMSMHWT